MLPRTLPAETPETLTLQDAPVLSRQLRSDDVIVYRAEFGGGPTWFVVMAVFDPTTAPRLDGLLAGRRALVVADRDGVVKTSAFLEDTDPAHAAAVMLPTALAAGRDLERAGVGLVIATNQGGYQAGHNTFEDVLGINLRVVQQLDEAGGRVDAVLVCPFDEPVEERTVGIEDARKPAPGMPAYARWLADGRGVPTLAMVGDQRTDGAAGQAAGLGFFAVTDGNGRWDAERESAEEHGEILPALDHDPRVYAEVPTFADAVAVMLGQLDRDDAGRPTGAPHGDGTAC